MSAVFEKNMYSQKFTAIHRYHTRLQTFSWEMLSVPMQLGVTQCRHPNTSYIREIVHF